MVCTKPKNERITDAYNCLYLGKNGTLQSVIEWLDKMRIKQIEISAISLSLSLSNTHPLSLSLFLICTQEYHISWMTIGLSFQSGLLFLSFCCPFCPSRV